MNKCTRRKTLRLGKMCGLLITPLLFSFSSAAYNEGDITPEIVGGFKYDVPISSMDLNSNKVGTKVVRTWNMGGRYTVDIHCSRPITDASRFYTATTTMATSSTPGYLVLNDYIDVKVEVFQITGMVRKVIISPCLLPGGLIMFLNHVFHRLLMSSGIQCLVLRGE